MRLLLVALLASSAFAQPPQPIPYFTSNSIHPIGNGTKLLAPRMVLELYGQHLAPRSSCEQKIFPKAPLPLEHCGVRVLVGSNPAGLMFVSTGQINFTIPAGAPTDGTAPIRVCVGAVCSAPVMMRFSTHTAWLTAESPAYVHMPVWIDVEAPSPYLIAYPCAEWPWSFEGYDFEVLRDGRPIARLPEPSRPRGSGASCLGHDGHGRFPLHLIYRFDAPGPYSVRLTMRKGAEVLYQSGWTTIRIEPFSEQTREAWLRSMEAQIGSHDVEYVVPSLLAMRDQKALAVLLKVIPENVSRCRDYDCVRLALGRSALAGFDNHLLWRVIPAGRLRELCPPDGNCKSIPARPFDRASSSSGGKP